MNIIQMRRCAFQSKVSSALRAYAEQYGVYNEVLLYLAQHPDLYYYANKCPQLIHSLVYTDYVPFLDNQNIPAGIESDIYVSNGGVFDLYFYINEYQIWGLLYGQRASSNSLDQIGLGQNASQIGLDAYLSGRGIGGALSGVSVGQIIHSFHSQKSISLRNCSTGTSTTNTSSNTPITTSKPIYFGGMRTGAGTAATLGLRGGMSRITYTHNGNTTILAPYNDGTQWGLLNITSLQFLPKTQGDGILRFVLKQRNTYMTY